MKSKRLKLLGVGLGVVLVILVGTWLVVTRFDFGKKEKTDNQIAVVINDGVDTDGDGLSDKDEREKNTNVYQSDTDNDGYLDGEEVAKGFNPLVIESYDKVDQDGDGLVGTDEKKYGTDPRLADSDFDGYQDGEEVVSGNNPLSANLADYVPIKAVVNASAGGQLASNNSTNTSNGTGEADEAKQTDSNVVEVSDKDREQVGYLEQAFSAQDAATLQSSMVNYIESESKVEKVAGQVQLPEVSDAEVKIAAGTSDNQVRNYISNMGDIFYQGFNFQEQGGMYNIQAIDSVESDLVYQFTSAVTSSLTKVKELEVPQEDKLIELHKKVVASLIRAEDLANKISEGSYLNTGSQDDVISIMNDYSELTYILKSQIIDNYLNTLNQVAEERKLK